MPVAEDQTLASCFAHLTRSWIPESSFSPGRTANLQSAQIDPSEKRLGRLHLELPARPPPNNPLQQTCSRLAVRGRVRNESFQVITRLLGYSATRRKPLNVDPSGGA